MTRNERQLKAVEKEMARHSEEAQSIWKKADEEDRETSNEERGEVEKHLKAIETLKSQKSDLEEAIKVEQDVKALSGKMGPTEPVVNGDGSDSQLSKVQVGQTYKTLGQIFTESADFQDMQKGLRDKASVEIDMKGTLLTGTGAPGTGTGGGLLPAPQITPGVTEKLFQPISATDIIPSGNINTNSVRYIVEGTATSGAAGVPEGGAKPESTLGLSTVDEPVKKIATVLHTSDEALEDAGQVEAYINRRLSLFVRIEEERQVLIGGGSDDLTGITGRTGVLVYARGTVDNNAVAIFKALNGLRGSALLEPDYLVMHPDNWQSTRLLMDANNQFYGGGPFTGAYGNTPVPAGVTSGQLTGALDYLWNKPIVVTSRITTGTALLGSFQAASMLWRKSGVTVEASNSHDQHFVKNLVAIRAESRLALQVDRPSAFVKITGLS